MKLNNLLTGSYKIKAFSVIALIYLQACSLTPSVETRHKYIPPKKNEYTNQAEGRKNSTPSNQNQQSQTSSVDPIVAVPVPTQEQSIINNIAITSTEIEKPKSNINYPTNTKKIGVILPMSGKNSNLGQRALNAIKLGLSYDGKDSLFSIAVFDSQSNADLAQKGVEKLLRDDNVIAILGGLNSREAQAISEKAEYFQVPFFAFSQKSGLTQNTDFTFRNSITPEMQVEKLVHYALKNLGAKRFAILYPNDPYGVEFANKYWDMVLAGGGEVTAAQPYDPKDTDLNIYIQKLVGTYYPEARMAEYRQRLQEIKLKNKKKKTDNVKKNSRENEAKENILSPIVDFDVLFIPDSGKALGQIIAFMSNNDVSQMTYMGTNLWNTPDLSRRAGLGSNNIFFVDSFISTDTLQKSEFHNKYLTVYKEEPSLIEAQLFEASKILRDIIGNRSVSREALADNLKILGHNKGAYTDIRMNNNHELERPLNIFGLKGGTINALD